MNHIGLYLKDVFFNKKTGCLSFKRKEAEKYFFFVSGRPVQVKTNIKSERLGDILLKLQKIQEETYTRLEDFLRPDQPLGESLKRGGVIKEVDLKEALAFQIRESLLAAFAYFDGTISFQEREDLEPPLELPILDVPSLIDYGLRRMKYDPAIQKFFSGQKVGLKNTKYVHFLNEEEKALLESFSVTQVVGETPVPSHFNTESYYKCLYLFYCLDMINILGAEAKFKKEDLGREIQRGREKEEPEASLEDLKEMKSQLKTRNYYELLGLSRTASEEEIKKAYFNLARKYHPDRFNRGSSDQALINEVFNAITTAYRTLSDPVKRKQYDQQLAASAYESVDDLSRKAEVKYRQGRTLYNQGAYEEALVFLEEAIRLRKNKADYYLLLALTESKLPAYKKKAEEDFLKSIEMEPWNAEGHLGLGLLYLSEGLRVKARKQIQKALEIDPDHHQAKQALAELEKGEKKTGLKSLLELDLSKLLKKKK